MLKISVLYHLAKGATLIQNLSENKEANQVRHIQTFLLPSLIFLFVCFFFLSCIDKTMFMVLLLGYLHLILTVESFKTSFEPPHDKTNEMACAPTDDSDQPRHPPSLIRVFAVCMKKAWVLNYLLSAQ